MFRKHLVCVKSFDMKQNIFSNFFFSELNKHNRVISFHTSTFKFKRILSSLKRGEILSGIIILLQTIYLNYNEISS